MGGAVSSLIVTFCDRRLWSRRFHHINQKFCWGNFYFGIRNRKGGKDEAYMVGTVPTEFPPLQTSLSGEAYRRKVKPVLRKFVLPNGKNLEPWKERGRLREIWEGAGSKKMLLGGANVRK